MTTTHARTTSRVSTGNRLGPDGQVDDKALLFVPTDPALTDPFLALVEDWFSTPGFEWHPHRGLETVTTVVGGVLEHGDNLGHVGSLEPGEVQWMTAGSGIIHRELAYRNEHAHVLQMWLNLPAADKMAPAHYQDLVAATMPRVHAPGVVIDVHSGTVDGVTGRATTHTSVQGLVATLDRSTSYELTVPAEHRLFAHVMDGRLLVGGRELHAGQIAWSDPVTDVADTALQLATHPDRPARVMIYSGTPIGEGVALRGPFVMNTDAELDRAYGDYRRGAFGPIPRQTRLDALR